MSRWKKKKDPSLCINEGCENLANPSQVVHVTRNIFRKYCGRACREQNECRILRTITANEMRPSQGLLHKNY